MTSKPRLLVANRGEIAVRIMRTAREMDIPTVAVYSDADRDALHVELADEAHRIGPALAADSYLSIPAILEAAQRSRATLVHPGYGFLAERAQFAQAVEDAGLTFVGPSADAIERMGDKAAAPRHRGRGRHADRPGDARAGRDGGGEETGASDRLSLVGQGGVRRRREGDARRPRRRPPGGSLKRAAREAQSYFGRAEVFLERFVDHGRHVEAQVIADSKGNVVFLGERDCSVQRRHQKLIEETPSPSFDDRIRERFAEAAVSLTREAGYVNAGTIECILDEDGSFYFLEMNTRLQVEHTVTEMVTGLDLVSLQLEVALGGSLAGLDRRLEAPRSSAVSTPRTRAGTSSQPGTHHAVSGARRTVRPGRLRHHAGAVRSPGDYDSMFAKLVVGGTTVNRRAPDAPGLGRVRRREASRRRSPSTAGCCRRTRSSRPTHTTTWLEKALATADLPAQSDLGPAQASRTGTPTDLLVEVDGRRVPVRVFDERREVAPKAPEAHAGHGGGHVHGEIRAPMQGTIVKVLVEKGQEIRAGDVVCILEAMKMENHIASQREGEITDLPIRAGQVVETGQVLAVLD